MLRTLVVLPTLNEAGNITEVLRRIRAAMPTAHALVVDDGSPDGTAAIAEAVASEVGSIDVLRRPRPSGLGTAYRAGFGWGMERGYEVFVEMDADLSHDPAALPRLVRMLEDSGVDLVIGSRYVPGGTIPGWSIHRRALSKWGNRYAARVLDLEVADLTSGYRAYRASVLRRIDLATVRADGYGFQIEMAHRVAASGGRIAEMPIDFRDRTHGKSKMSSRIIAEALLLVTWWGVRDRVARRREDRTT